MQVAVEQMKKRLLSAKNMFANLTKISFKIILSQISRCSFTELQFLKLFADKLTVRRSVLKVYSCRLEK